MNVLRLIPEQGNETIVIDQDRVLVGRDAASDVHLKDASVSRRHAEIQKGTDGEWVIIDLDSSNGVHVDGVRTPESVLGSGQRLQIGSVGFRVEVDRGDDGSTVILKRSPFAAGSRTTILSEPPPNLRSASPPPSERPAVLLVTALVVSGLVVAMFGVLALYWPRPQTPPKAAAAAPIPLPTPVEPPAPRLVPATPVQIPVPAPPRGALLISTDIRAEVLVDGQSSGAIEAGGLRRVGVVPGDHIVSFLVADARHDQLVHANANEQAVVRFSGGATSLPSPSPVPPALKTQESPTPAALRLATISPMSSPSTEPLPATVSPTPSVVPATPSPATGSGTADRDLQTGMAATRRGDFFRALLVLKDVVKRLEQDPRAGRELALADAYLAWTYHGLGRPEEARAAAEKALKANPDVLAGLENPPVEVASLLKRRR
jgi:hypothetical protein